MDSSQYGGAAKAQQNVPPLGTMVTFGTLQYNDPHNSVATTITPDITGTIDKGFFLSENEWTCYRRNYFSCVCSFNLQPYYANVPITFQATSSQTAYPVSSFGMSISAMVADTDGHKIDLVQHTPKRDKGPITTPDKVIMAPKSPQAAGHHASNLMFGGHADPSGAGMGGRSLYDSAYGQPQTSAGPTTEHSFERIQFKQATANNGKRRAAQQYYHLVVELWVDVGSQDHPQWLKVAQRKSAKMIVRGRSPGHYQSERRSSTSSGPGGSGGGLGGYGGGVMGSDFGSGNTMMGSNPYGGYDPRPGAGGYGVGARHHSHHVQVPAEAEVAPEDAKNIESRKGLQIYSAGAYEGADTTGRVEQYPPLPRSENELTTSTPATSSSIVLPQLATGFDPTGSKVKNEYDTAIPSICYPGPSYSAGRCGPYDSKTTSAGYYPTMLPTPGLNMT
ncbi:hypothetical protein MKZ38_005214 [Zalerion maritima]|uniref:NDT80 domain-containing protein n=1 Tax=Zalerion maritima TaxID=339359 RepID=A0AAD5WP44_9PEZI|nr:hypothetical protein MKZ38_005214 [Zalerion maritima]